MTRNRHNYQKYATRLKFDIHSSWCCTSHLCHKSCCILLLHHTVLFPSHLCHCRQHLVGGLRVCGEQCGWRDKIATVAIITMIKLHTHFYDGLF